MSSILKEILFFSYVEGNAAELELGDEVEFTLSHKTAKVSAENIRKLSKGTVAPEVIRSVRSVLKSFCDNIGTDWYNFTSQLFVIAF